jgi:putative FmdB family regulatory protein
MPLYDYRCEDCGEFRALRPMSEADALQPCPVCGTASARMLSAPFLGGGQSSGGWLTTPRRDGQGHASWRAACGFGCSHVNCR